MTSSHLSDDLQRIHRVVTRGLRVALARGAAFARDGFADAPTRRGYLDYVASLLTTLHTHHHGEETLLLPRLRERLTAAPFAAMDSEHQALEAQMIEGRRLVAEGQRGAEAATWLSALLAVLGRVEGIWRAHIAVEEAHLDAPALDGALSAAERAGLQKAFGEHGRRMQTPAPLCLPFILFNLEPDDRAQMERKLPFIVSRVVVPWVWKSRWAAMRPFLLA